MAMSYLEEERDRQGIFNDVMGIPATGRSRYETWLANQWETSNTEYEFRKALRLILAGMTFEQFLRSYGAQTAFSPPVVNAI